MRERRHEGFSARGPVRALIVAIGVGVASTAPAIADPVSPSPPPSIGSSRARGPMGPMVVTVTGDVVRLGGGISRALPTALDAILDRHPQVRTVLLDSPGGEIFGGLSTAELIRRRGLNTMVPFNSDCASACVILLAAGVERRVAPGTKVGVHAWRYARPVGADVFEKDAIALRSTFVALGISGDIVDLMVATPHASIRWLTHKEMRDLKLITDEIAAN